MQNSTRSRTTSNESVSRGTVAFADDPFEVNANPRPIVILSPGNRPYGDEERTIVRLGTDAEKRYELATPPVERLHRRARFDRKTYVLPQPLYTIPLETIDESQPIGQLGADGVKLVAHSIYEMLRTQVVSNSWWVNPLSSSLLSPSTGTTS